MAKVIRLPQRSQVKAADTWDLSSLYDNDDAWEKDFAKFQKLIGGFEKFRGTLADSAKQLAACLKFDGDVDHNNHRYLADSVLMAWGAYTGDQKFYDIGEKGFMRALGDARADGSLPLETRRDRLWRFQ